MIFFYVTAQNPLKSEQKFILRSKNNYEQFNNYHQKNKRTNN